MSACQQSDQSQILTEAKRRNNKQKENDEQKNQHKESGPEKS